MKKGPFEVISSKVVYKNPWITIREDNVKRPEGKNGIFGVVTYQTGVLILALDKKWNIYCIKEYMYGIERKDVQIPAGGIDEDETPLQAAKRELFEETGLISKNWVYLGIAYSNTSIMNTPFHMFLAMDVTRVGKSEIGIKIFKYSFDKVLTMVESGVISNSGTLSTLLKAKLYLEHQKA